MYIPKGVVLKTKQRIWQPDIHNRNQHDGFAISQVNSLHKQLDWFHAGAAVEKPREWLNEKACRNHNRIEAHSHTFEIPRFTPQRRVLLRVDWFIGLAVLFGIGQSYF